MEEQVNKKEKNKNLVILLLLLIIVAIAAQTVFMYKMFNNLHEKMLVIVNPLEKVCPVLKSAQKSVCTVSAKQPDAVQKNSVVKNDKTVPKQTKPMNKNVNILNAEKILNENAQLISQGMKENSNSYVCSYKVPGATKKDISIESNGNYLTVGVQMKRQISSNDKNNPFSVESYSIVHKSIPVPANVDKGKISAELENGVLTLVFPKIK